jgi:hypothetical protein
VVTHLETAVGHSVVTAPLVRHEEVHLSGSGQLSAGRATIQFDADAADMIVHTDSHPYRVLVTPGGVCGGLAVSEKAPTGFQVEEINGGHSDVTFDWLVISRKPSRPGSGEPTELPDRLPEIPEPRPSPS